MSSEFVERRPPVREEILHTILADIEKPCRFKRGYEDPILISGICGINPSIGSYGYRNAGEGKSCRCLPNLVACHHEDTVIKSPGRQVPEPALQFFLSAPSW